MDSRVEATVLVAVAGPNGILDVVDGPDGSLYISTADSIQKVVLVPSQAGSTLGLSLLLTSPQKYLIGG